MNYFGPLVSILLTIGFSIAPSESQAQDPSVQQALRETQDALRDASKRQEILDSDAKARSVDDSVKRLTGGDAAQNDAIYGIAADAFGPILQAAGNDPAKVMESLQKAQSDPEGFYKSLPEDVRVKIRGVASDIEKKNHSRPSP